MRTLSLSEAKAKLSELVEAVEMVDETVMITKHGRPAAVLVSPDEFESWQETIAIRFDGDMMADVEDGLKALRERTATLYTLDELLPDEDE